MTWRLARSLEVLRNHVNAMVPGRSKVNDGSIGDEKHQARSSDHNPWIKEGSVGIVSAIDITHDPAHGFDSYAFADMLVGNKDHRIKYIISNRRIASGADEDHPAWKWRPYTGTNPHDHHVHISVKSDKAHYDSADQWKIDGVSAPASTEIPSIALPKLRQGDTGDDVKHLQALLNGHGTTLKIDGNFGPGTAKAVREFQTKLGIVADGIVGGYTWKELAV